MIVILDLITKSLPTGDILIWIQFTRALFSLVIAALFLMNPLNGYNHRNKSLHRFLSVYFFAAAWSAFERATARMSMIVYEPQHLIQTPGFFISEFIVTVVLLALAVKMGIDFYKFKMHYHLSTTGKIGKVI